MRIPIVAIIGRPNAGKSVLFNRLIKERLAIEANEAGTTRDRVMKKIQTSKLDYCLVDTGGVQSGNLEDLENNVQEQTKLAINEADLILFMLDSKSEFTTDDYHIAEQLRKYKKKNTEVVLVLTKCDQCNEAVLQDRPEIYEFGFGEPILLSAIHNWGLSELTSKIVNDLLAKGFMKSEIATHEADENIVAVLGRPNVGKSSLINSLLTQPKLIVSDIPGTTRDATDTLVNYHQKEYLFIDTAGIRRRGKIEVGIEKFSVFRSLQSVYRSQVSLMVLDGSGEVTKQDQHLAGEIVNQRKGLILVVNKIDKVEFDEEWRRKYINQLRRKFAFTPWAPVLFVSAESQKNIWRIFPLIEKIVVERQKRVATAEMNKFLRKITLKHMPTGATGQRPKIFYVTQTDINPPEFVFFVNNKDCFHFSYLRYIENELRKEFGFEGTVMKVVFRSKGEKK